MERANGHSEQVGFGPIPPTPVDLSARVLSRLRATGWSKGSRSGGNGVCLLGAYAEELCGDPGEGVPLHVLITMRKVIAEQYPDKYAANDIFVVPKFNDDPDITWNDVERVLEKVVAIEQERA